MPGKMTEITDDGDWSAADDIDVFLVPFNKLLDITRIQINNRVNEDIRVRGWDSFTDTDGTARRVPLFDYPVASQDAVVVDCADESKRVMGTLVIQARSGTGTGITEDTPVEVYVGGEYPF
jgi:hypothetical protein